MKTLSPLLVTLALVLVGISPASAADGASVFHRSGNLEVYGNGPHYLDLGLGLFDVTDENSGAVRVEARLGRKLFFVGPALGLLANTDGGYFGYGALYADIAYKKLLITPLWGMGGYEEGDGLDLGGTLRDRQGQPARGPGRDALKNTNCNPPYIQGFDT